MISLSLSSSSLSSPPLLLSSPQTKLTLDERLQATAKNAIVRRWTHDGSQGNVCADGGTGPYGQRGKAVGWGGGPFGKKQVTPQPGGGMAVVAVAPTEYEMEMARISGGSPGGGSSPGGCSSPGTSEFDDDEAEEGIKLAEERARARRLWLLHPTQPAKLAWDALLALLVIYSVLIVPIRVGFAVEAARGGAWEFEVTVDFIFLLDVLVNFRSAFYRHHAVTAVTELETRACKISRRYGGSWFLIDLLSSVPLDLILHLAIPDAGDDGLGGLCGAAKVGAAGEGEASDTETLKLVKLLKGLRLVRLLKLLRLFKIGRFLQKLQDELEVNPTVIELLKLGVKMVFLMHMVGCGWNWMRVPPLHDDEAVDALPTWVDAVPDLAAYADRCEAAPFGELYTAAMLWALTTMSTIGFGDIKAITNAEKFYSMIIMLVGSVIFGVVIGGMTELMAQFDAVAVRSQAPLRHGQSGRRCMAPKSPRSASGRLLAALLTHSSSHMHTHRPRRACPDRTSSLRSGWTSSRRRCASGTSRTSSCGARSATTRTTSPTAPTCRPSSASSPSSARRCAPRSSSSSTRASSRPLTFSAAR